MWGVKSALQDSHLTKGLYSGAIFYKRESRKGSMLAWGMKGSLWETSSLKFLQDTNLERWSK